MNIFLVLETTTSTLFLLAHCTSQGKRPCVPNLAWQDNYSWNAEFISNCGREGIDMCDEPKDPSVACISNNNIICRTQPPNTQLRFSTQQRGHISMNGIQLESGPFGNSLVHMHVCILFHFIHISNLLCRLCTAY